MLKLQNNKYIKKLLESSNDVWDKRVNSLSLAQIEWRLENQTTVLGILCKTGIFFSKTVELIILKNSEGQYALFSPATRKDSGIPCYLYDILDIEEFVKRYPIQLVYDTDVVSVDDLYDELEAIKDRPRRGFIETRPGQETQIYEIVLER